MKNSSISNPLANSKLTETILKINPGVERQTQIQNAKLTKLMKKSSRNAEFSRKLQRNEYQHRIEQRKIMYERLKPKLDDTTRTKIDQIKEKERKKELEKKKVKEAEKLIRKNNGVRKTVDQVW